MKNSELIDLHALQEISFGDKERMKKFIHIFLKNVPVVISGINEALDKGENEKLVPLIHNFKPQVKMMGIVNLKAEIDPLESEVREYKDPSQVREKLQRFIVEIQNAAAELMRLISEDDHPSV